MKGAADLPTKELATMNYAVIGANYGDEGKGLITDYLSAQAPRETLVIRFNGGANAGHTVVTPDGQRHIFGHYGSGTLAGARTLLAREFICNPILCNIEFKHLRRSMNDAPEPLLVDPACIITTPWDMMINQLIETKRGDGRHGSCGVGINETVVRSAQSDFRFTVADLPRAADIIQRIRNEWLPARLDQLGLDREHLNLLHEANISERFLSVDLPYFRALIEEVLPLNQPPAPYTRLIFEGAQGLCLDRDNTANFPHVTNSKTGLANVMWMVHNWAALEPWGDCPLQVIYCTRTYLTRHGAGPLADERPMNIVDTTNKPHDFQGRLRCAPFSIQSTADMFNRITADFAQFGSVRGPQLAVTHCDQVSASPELRQRGHLFSFGPTRMHIHDAR